MNLNELSATMITQLKVNADHPMVYMVRAFNTHQLQKAESASGFLTQVIGGAEEINVQDVPKIMSSIAYAQHCDPSALGESIEIDKLGELVVSCMQKITIAAPDEGQKFFGSISRLPESVLRMIYEYWCGDKLPITMINFYRDFRVLSYEATESTESEGSNKRPRLDSSEDTSYEDFWWGTGDDDTTITDGSTVDILGSETSDF